MLPRLQNFAKPYPIKIDNQLFYQKSIICCISLKFAALPREWISRRDNKVIDRGRSKHQPVRTFSNAWHNPKEHPMAPSSSMWPEATSDFLDCRRSVQVSVTLLASFFLISRDSDASLSLHPLVHDWCRGRMSAVEQQSGCRRAVSLLIGSVGRKFKMENYSFRPGRWYLGP